MRHFPGAEERNYPSSSRVQITWDFVRLRTNGQIWGQFNTSGWPQRHPAGTDPEHEQKIIKIVAGSLGPSDCHSVRLSAKPPPPPLIATAFQF